MKILMVCLGNICRSPLAEGIMRNIIDKNQLSASVDSAGTSNYHIGGSPDSRSQKNALSHQIDISQLKARQFTVNDFDNFDLIYAMDEENYNNILSLSRSIEDENKVMKILNEANPNLNQDVPDPYFGDGDGFETVYQLINEACLAILKNRFNVR